MKNLATFLIGALLICLSQQLVHLTNSQTQQQMTQSILTPKPINIVQFVEADCPSCDYLTAKLQKMLKLAQNQGRNDISHFVIDCSKQLHLCQVMKITQKPYISIFDTKSQMKFQIPGKITSPQMVYQEILQSIRLIDLEALQSNNYHQVNVPSLNASQSTRLNKIQQSEYNVLPSNQTQQSSTNSNGLIYCILLGITILTLLHYSKQFLLKDSKPIILLSDGKNYQNIVKLNHNKQEIIKSNKNIPKA